MYEFRLLPRLSLSPNFGLSQKGKSPNSSPITSNISLCIHSYALQRWELNRTHQTWTLFFIKTNRANWNCLINRTEPELITMGSVQSLVSTVVHSFCTVELNVLDSSYIPVPPLLLLAQKLAKNCQKWSYVCWCKQLLWTLMSKCETPILFVFNNNNSITNQSSVI